MPYRVVEFRETPNPNALKCILDASPRPTPLSVRSAEQAQSDPIAKALFAIPGVNNLLIHDGWITVGKAQDAKWPAIKSAVERTLRDLP